LRNQRESKAAASEIRKNESRIMACATLFMA
jgi:hypothetical protein